MDDRAAGPVVTRSSNRWRGAALVWAFVFAAALLLPVTATAAWLNATTLASRADVVAGVWILKVSVMALAAFGLILGRLRVPIDANPGRPETARVDARSLFLVFAVLLIGLAVRLYRLDAELWLDEIYLRTLLVEREFRHLISTYDTQNHQPLYSILSRVSFLAAGGTDWSLRIPAVLSGVGSLAAVWWFGRRITSDNEAILAPLLLSVSYHHVWFSQNARGYTLMLLLAVLATGYLLRLLEGGGRHSRLAWGYALAMSLATYTHLTAALIAVGHALTLLLTTRWTSPESRRRASWPMIALARSALLTVCFYAPMLPQVWREVSMPTMEGVQVEWTGARWMLSEGVRVLAQGIPGGLLTVFGALGVLAVGVGSYWRQSRTLTLLMYLPIGVTFVAVMAARHNLWPRFFFFASGFLVLGALRGGFVLVRSLIRWHPQRIGATGVVAMSALSLLTVPAAWQPKQQFRAAHDFVEQQRRPGDEVVAVGLAALVYELRGWTPAWHSAHDLDSVRVVERSAARTWIVYTLPAHLRALERGLYEYLSGPTYREVRVFTSTVGGGEIHILLHDSAIPHD